MNAEKKDLNIVLSISVATVIGKALGLLKDTLISYYYGTTKETDAFFLALSIPTTLLGVFTASTDSAVIPQYLRILKDTSKSAADRLFSSIVNSLLVVCICISLIVFVFPKEIVSVFAPGFDESAVATGARYLRIFAPIGILHMLYCFFCTYNAAFKKNGIRAILAFSTNLIIVIALICYKDQGLEYLAFAYLLGNIVCALLPIIEMKSNKFEYTPLIELKNSEFKKFWLLFIPIMGGALLNDIQQFVDKNLCSSIVGGISYLNYGSKLINIFDSILVVGIGVVLLPILSKLSINGDLAEFSTICSRVTRYLIEILSPVFIILFKLATPFIVVLFGRGKFDESSITAVSMVLKAYSGLIIFMPMITIFSKYFHSKEKNGIPFALSALAVILNTSFSILFKSYWGVIGVALATTLASSIEILLFIIIIEKQIVWDRNEISLLLLSKIGIVSLSCYIIIGIFDAFHLSEVLSIFITSMTVIIVYAIGYWLLLRPDYEYFITKIKALL